VRLGDLTWTEAAQSIGSAVLAVPLGSTEQHGPHLPLSTDTDVAVHLAGRLAAAVPGVVVAPALPYGSSGEHAGFAGTLSIGREALEQVVVELVRSADDFSGVVLVSAHGGNADAVARATSVLVREGRRVLAWSPSISGADAHAGRTETALMLALSPSSVRLEAAAPGNRRPLADLAGALRRGGVAAVSPNGVLGDPLLATAEEGVALLDALAARLVSEVTAWR
jgi:mycofactocin system creatininase family protein